MGVALLNLEQRELIYASNCTLEKRIPNETVASTAILGAVLVALVF